MPPTEPDLDRPEELAGAATPGPWRTNVTVYSERDVVITDWLKDGNHLVLADLSFECTYVGLTLEERRANARLIVALRNALPAILAKLREGERAEELNAASHDMLMKANARLTAEHSRETRRKILLEAADEIKPINPSPIGPLHYAGLKMAENHLRAMAEKEGA